MYWIYCLKKTFSREVSISFTFTSFSSNLGEFTFDCLYTLVFSLLFRVLLRTIDSSGTSSGHPRPIKLTDLSLANILGACIAGPMLGLLAFNEWRNQKSVDSVGWVEEWVRNYYINKLKDRGSGCGSVVRAVASDTSDPRFKSKHRQNFIFQLYNRKDKHKEKEAENGPS